MTNTFKFILGTIAAVLILGVSAHAQTVLTPKQGGTGTGTAPSNGKLLIGNGAGKYTVANLTQGSNITITNASGSITIAATGSGGTSTITINQIPTSTFTLAGTSNQITITSSSPSTITFALPQDIATASTPQFAGASLGKTLSSNVVLDIKTLNATRSRGLRVESDNVANIPFGFYVTSDAQLRFTSTASGILEWGDGTVGGDTNLYRSASSTLKTDDTFNAAIGITSPRGDLTSVSSTNITASGYGTFPSLGFTNATGTGNLQSATAQFTGNVNASSTLNVQGATELRTSLNVIGHSTTTNLSVTSISGSTQCVQADTTGKLSGSGSACGSGSGGSGAGYSFVMSPDNAVLPDSAFANPGRTAGTNVVYNYLSYTNGATSSAQWSIPIPSGITFSTATLDVFWTSTSTATGTVTWSFDWVVENQSSTVDLALGGANATSSIATSYSSTTASVLMKSSVNLPTSTLAADRMMFMKITRGNTGLSSAAQLIKAVLRFF